MNPAISGSLCLPAIWPRYQSWWWFHFCWCESGIGSEVYSPRGAEYFFNTVLLVVCIQYWQQQIKKKNYNIFRFQLWLLWLI